MATNCYNIVDKTIFVYESKWYNQIHFEAIKYPIELV